MTSSSTEMPRNPFVSAEDYFLLEGQQPNTADDQEVVRLTHEMVPFSADGFELLSTEVDWSQPELLVLKDAARWVRWISSRTNLPESEVIHYSLDTDHGVTLILPGDAIDDTGEK